MDKLKNQISFRPAIWGDAEFLMALRNDPLVWMHSIQARMVKREEHLEWFRGVLQRDDVKLFILLHEGISIGQIRYEIKQDGVFVSVAISADYRGKGIAVQALKLTGQKIFSLPKVTILKALVNENNMPSLRCFEKAGFSSVGRETHRNEYFIIMERRKTSVKWMKGG